MNFHFIPFFQRRSVLPPRSEHAVDKQTQGQSKGRGEGAAGKESSGGARKEKKKRERGVHTNLTDGRRTFFGAINTDSERVSI